MICISSRSLARMALQPLDRLEQLGQLVEDLLPLEAGQALQLHVENRLRLDLRQREARHQPVARFLRALRAANQRDHRIEVIERDLQPFQDVIPRLGLAQLELGAPADDLAPEIDEALDQLQQIQYLRPAADDREHDDAEARLQRRVLVEVVENDLRHARRASTRSRSACRRDRTRRAGRKCPRSSSRAPDRRSARSASPC